MSLTQSRNIIMSTPRAERSAAEIDRNPLTWTQNPKRDWPQMECREQSLHLVKELETLEYLGTNLEQNFALVLPNPVHV